MGARTRLLAFCAIAATSMLIPASLAPDARAQFQVPFYEPIADCGTIGFAAGYYDFDGDGENEDCLAWFADSGGAYFFNGIDVYNPGDRVYVEGDVCLFCDTTCAAGAIENACSSECVE